MRTADDFLRSFQSPASLQVIPHYDQALRLIIDLLTASCPKPRLIVDLAMFGGGKRSD